MPQGARIYNLFPLLAGTVSAWEKHLDRIAGMGFNWIFLNPFHYPGLSGSLYAVKDYYALNPLFADSAKDGPDETIGGFVEAAGARGISVMMDLVVNHTAKDSLVAEQHPEWFIREPDGSLASPYAVDPTDTSKRTVWADLAEIDYRDRPERAAIVAYFAGVVRHYVRLGFRGFRCDAAYKVPKDVWRALIAAGQQEQDDVLFIAENLGSLLEQTLALRGVGFRLPVQQRQMVGLPAELVARSVRAVPFHRTLDLLPGDPRHRSADQRTLADRHHRPECGRAALQGRLPVRRRLLDRA